MNEIKKITVCPEENPVPESIIDFVKKISIPTGPQHSGGCPSTWVHHPCAEEAALCGDGPSPRTTLGLCPDGCECDCDCGGPSGPGHIKSLFGYNPEPPLSRQRPLTSRNIRCILKPSRGHPRNYTLSSNSIGTYTTPPRARAAGKSPERNNEPLVPIFEYPSCPRKRCQKCFQNCARKCVCIRAKSKKTINKKNTILRENERKFHHCTWNGRNGYR